MPLSAREREQVLRVFGRQGFLRDRLHTRGGARLVNVVTLPWWSVWAPSGAGILKTVGRKTGKRRPRSLRVIVRGRKAYFVSIGGDLAAWVKNLRASPRVILRVNGKRLNGLAREPRDEHELQQAKMAYCATVNPMDYFVCWLHRRGLPTRSKIEDLHRTWFEYGIPFIIEFD